MNNLLRTLTESQARPGSDLKLLLTAVKETRRQGNDSRSVDAFYESLENLLADLRTITIDNRDAEAFLKPVSRAEVPDYYDYITQPMDLATMGKRVKSRHYKSKRDFKDDLDLIWSNCYKYNAAEDHPLRQCVDRLKAKAERLLKHITDRRDRTDPQIPFELAPQVGIARPKVNGLVNGTTHSRSPSVTNGRPPPQPKKLNTTFAESPALVRTGEGMAAFRELDKGLSGEAPDPKAVQRLKSLAPHASNDDESEDDLSAALDGLTGDKRKHNGVPDVRPRKRARFATLPDDLSQLWWHTVQTDSMLANGLPEIPYASSSSLENGKRPKRRKQKDPPTPNSKSLLNLMNVNIKSIRRLRHANAKLAAFNAATASQNDDPDGEGAPGMAPAASFMPGLPPGLGQTFAGPEEESFDERHWIEQVKAKRKGDIELGEENARDCMNWVGGKILEHAGFQGTSRGALEMLSNVGSEFLLNAGRTLRFMTDKYGRVMSPEEIILHTLFESGIQEVPDLERYISDDIERYGVRIVEVEKKTTAVHSEQLALFQHDVMPMDDAFFDEEDDEEAGTLAMGDFADSLGEDYLGLRELGIADEFGLTNLSIPKSLLRRKKAMRHSATKSAEPLLDYPLPPPFLPFTPSQSEDQIGLLKPYYDARFQQLAASQASQSIPPPSTLPGPSIPMPPLPGPSLPPLPGPSLPPLPGPSLPPLSTTPSLPSLSNTSLPTPTPPIPSNAIAGPSKPPSPSGPPVVSPDLPLPDDPIPPAQAKMGPIGQIIRPNLGAPKKKAKAAVEDGGPAAPGTPSAAGGGHTPSGGGGPASAASAINGPAAGSGQPPLKKKKGATGVGSGNGRKKKDPAAAQSQQSGGMGAEMQVSAAPSQASSNGGYNSNQGAANSGGSSYPSVVIASA